MDLAINVAVGFPGDLLRPGGRLQEQAAAAKDGDEQPATPVPTGPEQFYVMHSQPSVNGIALANVLFGKLVNLVRAWIPGPYGHADEHSRRSETRVAREAVAA